MTADATNVLQALERIQYPHTLREPAARHLLRVKSLAEDFAAYVNAGSPPVQPYGEPQPPSLSRPLPEGFTVGTLMSGFSQDLVTAFFLAVDLYLDPKRVLSHLEAILQNGITNRTETGAWQLFTVPAVEKSPTCPHCHAVMLRVSRFCKKCGKPLEST